MKWTKHGDHWYRNGHRMQPTSGDYEEIIAELFALLESESTHIVIGPHRNDMEIPTDLGGWV